MPLINPQQIEQIKSSVDIVDLTAKYVALKPAGSATFKGLCPFHEEKTASFVVNASTKTYHCFGCSAHGDSIGFLEQINAMSFVEAVEYLAQILGIQLIYERSTEDREINHIWGKFTRRTGMVTVNAAAHRIFLNQLWSQGGAEARDFLHQKGFSDQQIKRFEIGFAPNRWDFLSSQLQNLGWTRAQLVDAGLGYESSTGGVRDRFRGRIIWPIRELSQQIVGFGGRKIVPDDRDNAKYINTPETLVYKKSKVLYGLDLARKAMSQKQQAVVVEGYTDVMAMHLAGIETAVAPCGTAFTLDQARILRRLVGDYSDQDQSPARLVDSLGAEIIFIFDGDPAGIKAALRAFSQTQIFNAKTYVCKLPEGLDPCDLRYRSSNLALQELLVNKVPMFQFIMEQIWEKLDLNTVEGRRSAVKFTAPYIKEIADDIVRSHYIDVLADKTKISRSLITAEVERATSVLEDPFDAPGDAPGVSAEVQLPGAVSQTNSGFSRNFVPEPPADLVDDLFELPNRPFANQFRHPAANPFSRPLSSSVARTTATFDYDREVLGWILAKPELVRDSLVNLDPAWFRPPELSDLFKLMRNLLADTSVNWDAPTLQQRLSKLVTCGERKFLEQLISKPPQSLDKGSFDKTWQELCINLRKRALVELRAEIRKQAEQATTDEEENDLNEQRQQLTSEIDQLDDQLRNLSLAPF
jgi:DNA primase